MSPFVIVESPYAGDIDRNLRYVRACMRDCILRGEAPFASHALYTQPGVLRDEVHEERELGMGLGWRVGQHADRCVVYTDLGWSSGMVRGFNAATDFHKSISLRRLGGEWSTWDAGVDYARKGNPTDSSFEGDVPFDAANLQICDSENEADSYFIEIDTKQGYAVAYQKGSVHVRVINAPGRFRLETVKDGQ